MMTKTLKGHLDFWGISSSISHSFIDLQSSHSHPKLDIASMYKPVENYIYVVCKLYFIIEFIYIS